MGRPKEFRNPVSTSFRLEKEEYEEIEKIRWREHDDFGDVVRKAVQEYIRLHGEGNSTFKLDEWNLNPKFEAIPNMFAEDKVIRADFKSSNNQERFRRLKNAQRILSIYQDVNWRERNGRLEP